MLKIMRKCEEIPQYHLTPAQAWLVIGILRLVSSDIQTDAVRCVFNSVKDLYHGHFSGYRACNTGYHDLGHATATFLAMARLIHGAVLDGSVFAASNVVASSRMESLARISCPRSPGEAGRPRGSVFTTEFAESTEFSFCCLRKPNKSSGM